MGLSGAEGASPGEVFTGFVGVIRLAAFDLGHALGQVGIQRVLLFRGPLLLCFKQGEGVGDDFGGARVDAARQFTLDELFGAGGPG